MFEKATNYRFYLFLSPFVCLRNCLIKGIGWNSLNFCIKLRLLFIIILCGDSEIFGISTVEIFRNEIVMPSLQNRHIG